MLTTATTQRVFATLASTDPPRRTAVSLNNLDQVAELYVVLAATGAGTPSVTTTDNDVVVPPRSCRQFQIGPGIDLWIRSSAAGPVAYTALETL